ncbi:hypothetical protein CEQ90_00305 [Lewinellaceae bacterium SD302]|nr:hypothetical protein CEQ90_00305 [Lewinellaceae bacterium SD302]
MKKKSDLHALIQAMSRAEKRYFTLDARKGGRSQSRYLQLFQAINKQEIYDEKVLKATFGNKLNDDKSRLYEAILRSMRDYRSQRSRTARIKELLLDANFLYERQLYAQTEVRLLEAERIARELYDQPSLLEINRELRRLLNSKLDREEDHELSDLISDSRQSLGLLDEEFNYLNLFDRLIRTRKQVRQNKDSSAKTNNPVEDIERVDLLKSEPPVSVRARLRYYQSQAIYQQLLGNQLEVYNNFKAAVACWEEHPALKKEEFNRYLNDAFNLLFAIFNYPPVTKEARSLLDRLANESPKNIHDEAMLFQQVTTYRLFYAINYDVKTPADEILIPVEERLTKIELHPIYKMNIRFNAAILYFIQGAAERCEEWLDPIISQKDNTLLPDVNRSARLLRLLTLLDQGMEGDFIEAMLRSEQRQFNKLDKDRLTEFGLWLIKQLKHFNNEYGKGRKQVLSLAKEIMLRDWQNLPLELDQLIEKWLTARISGTSVLDLMQAE